MANDNEPSYADGSLSIFRCSLTFLLPFPFSFSAKSTCSLVKGYTLHAHVINLYLKPQSTTAAWSDSQLSAAEGKTVNWETHCSVLFALKVVFFYVVLCL